MNTFQKTKYYCYLLTGIFLIINLFFWRDTFTTLLCVAGILLITYALVCLRKQKNIFADFPKLFQYACRILVSIFIVSFLLIESLVIVYGTKQDDIKPDYIIVLGAALIDDKPSKALIDRLNTAYEQFQKYPDTTIICSGGKVKSKRYSEAEVMEEYLVTLGVPKKQILLEDKSSTTYENFESIDHLITNKKASFLIVTNNFHAFRAKLIADKFGMNAYSYSSQKLFDGFSANYIREYFAIVKTLVE